MSLDHTPQSTSKLPVGLAVEASLKSLFSDLPGLLRLSWPWLLIVGGFTYYLTRHFYASLDPTKAASFGLVTMAQQVVTFLAGAVMAVGWHRKVLLAEEPGAASALPGRFAFRYLFAAILIGIMLFAPLMVFVLLVGALLPSFAVAPGGAAALVVLLGMVAAVIAFAYAIRLSLVLPARAIGDNALTFGQALAATKGNTLRLLFGIFLTFVIPVLALQMVFMPLLGASLPQDPTMKVDMRAAFEAIALPTAIITMLTMLISMMGISFISFAYRHFFGATSTRAGGAA